MTKKTITKILGNCDIEYLSIPEIIEYLKRKEAFYTQEGIINLQISLQEYEYSNNEYIAFKGECLETDKEYSDRLKKEEQQSKWLEDRDAKEYERLKKKFDNV
jgi:hypothetical protein